MAKQTREKFLVYIAGPFFNPEQVAVIEAIKALLSTFKRMCTFYSPKDDSLYVPGKTDPQASFDMNVRKIYESSLVIAVTDGKDPGTLFESGYAYAVGTPIVYLWLTGLPGMKFNLMLAKSGIAVCRSWGDLNIVVEDFLIHDGQLSGTPANLIDGKEIE